MVQFINTFMEFFFWLLWSIVVYWVDIQNALVSQKQDKSVKTMCLPSYHQKGFIETHALGIAMSDSLFPLHGLPQNHYCNKEEAEVLSWFHMHLSLCIYIYIYIYIYFQNTYKKKQRFVTTSFVFLLFKSHQIL